MIDILGKIFGSPNRVKIMRFFLSNPDSFFSAEELSSKLKMKNDVLLVEIKILEKIEFLKKEKATRMIEGSLNKGVLKKRTDTVFRLNKLFPYVVEMNDLLIKKSSFDKEDLLKRLRVSGKMEMVIISGFFTDNLKSPADILIVGDRLDKVVLGTIIKAMERDMGRDIKYAVLGVEDFRYRFTVYDKFVRDILDFPHEKILNKLGF